MLVAALLAAYAARTFVRNWDWETEEALFRSAEKVGLQVQLDIYNQALHMAVCAVCTFQRNPLLTYLAETCVAELRKAGVEHSCASHAEQLPAHSRVVCYKHWFIKLWRSSEAASELHRLAYMYHYH